jgi:hypothetical protein
MVSKDSSDVEDVKKTIRDVLDIRELGQADKFLGMKILRDREQGVPQVESGANGDKADQAVQD